MHKDEEIIHASKENVASLVAGVAAGLSRVESSLLIGGDDRK